jgi:hypothetical protein
MASVEGKRIPDPGFGGDEGAADPALVAALAGYAARPAEPVGPSASPPDSAAALTAAAAQAALVESVQVVLDALPAARLLAPVVAVSGPDGDARPVERPRQPGGHAGEKTTDMALPTLLAADGRRALPVFTSLESLARWRPSARPVPVTTQRAALAALAEGADLLLIDPAGPVSFQVLGAPLRALAEGRAPLPPGRDPAVAATIERIAAGVAGVDAVRLRPGDADSDLRVVLEIAGDPTPVARAVADLLAADELLRSRLVRGLALLVLPPASVGESQLTV